MRPFRTVATIAGTSRCAARISLVSAAFLLLWMGPNLATAHEQVQNKKSLIDRAEQELLHAETYYWFGMAESGNMAAFREGLRHLARTSALIKRLPAKSNERSRLEARIEGMRTDLDKQIGMAIDTLYGVFPLVRFLSRSIFADSLSLGTYEIIDDPTVMASTQAAKLLALQTIKNWAGRHQLDVVFTSVPHNPELENEALYVFNSHPKFFVHNLREVVDALDAEQLADFQAGHTTPEVREALLAAFGVNDVLVVNVKQTDEVDGDYFYILKGKIHHVGEDIPTHDFSVMGFSRDRNAMFWPIILSNVSLLMLAYAAFWLSQRVRQRATRRVSIVTFLVAPLIAFTIGRVAPWAFGPLIKSISPVPETLAVASFWVPCLAGAAFTTLPMLVFWAISKRLAQAWPALSTDGRAAALCVGIGLGSAAYFAVPLFLYLPEQAPLLLAATTLTAAGLGYLLGRALDAVDRVSIKVAVVPVVLSLFVGFALFQAVAVWTWSAAGVVLLACTLPVLLHTRSTIDDKQLAFHPPQPEPAPMHSRVVNLNRIADCAEHPIYQKLAGLAPLLNATKPLMNDQTVHMALYGRTGSGLSSTAQALAAELVQSLGDREAILMYGECLKTTGEHTPYGPFQKALARHFEIELLASPEAKMAEVDAALGDVFQSVIPFAGILFPGAQNASGRVSTGEDIGPSIVWMLKRLAQRSPVILLIDDVQWIDESSRNLLIRLLSEFPVGGDTALAIIVMSHEHSSFARLGFAPANIRTVEFPTTAEQVQILTAGVGLAKSTAEQIVGRVGTSTSSQGGLFWLLQVVANLARANAFVATDGGAALANDTWPDDILVPDELRDVVADQLRKLSHEYRMIVACSACACESREFSASLIADALDQPRLQLLADLDCIDRETSLLYDVPDEDDMFAFQSSLMLDVLRDELKISRAGPDSDVPQIVREYHSRLAAHLEKSLAKNSSKLYAVANHYYAAGAIYADRGARYCIDAALAAASVLEFDAAATYLKWAEQCAHVSGDLTPLEECRLEIDCRRAHVTGQANEHAQVARNGAEYLEQHPDASTRVMLAVAQAHYDAGKTTGQSKWFARSLAIGEQIIRRANTTHDQALGRHFVAISLPPDQVDRRQDELRQALSLFDSAHDEPADFELQGHIMGALAETLAQGSSDDRQEARRLFEHRLQLNQQHQVGDPHGQAMTHGGLGRLALFYEPQDIEAATFHFRKDLEISQAIGDQQGQIQMHSLLGACDRQRGDVDQAIDHYQQSFNLAEHPINKTFAGAGLIACYAQSGNRSAFDQIVAELLKLNAEGVPTACAEDLAAALSDCPDDLLKDKAQALLDLARATSVPLADRSGAQ